MPRELYIYTHEFFPSRGGIATYCHEFATAAASVMGQVVVIGPKGAQTPDGTAPRYLLKQGNHHGSHNPSCVWKTRQQLRKTLHQHPAAIHLLAEPGPILAYGLLSQKDSRGQVQLTLHGSEIERWRSHPISRALASRAFRNAVAIQVVSTPVLQSLLQHFPEARDKATVVNNALPESFRQAAVHQAHDPLQPMKSGMMKLLSVGRIHPRKGFDQIIQALALLSEDEKETLHYKVAGASKDRAYLASLKRLAEAANIHIEFALNPNLDELKACYAAADVFALSSMPRKKSVEGFGIVYLEAGAYALPCLAYDTGGVCEAIQHNVTGFLVDVGNIDQLSEQIRFFLQNPDIRFKMGAANRAFALSQTWKNVVKKTLINSTHKTVT